MKRFLVHVALAIAANIGYIAVLNGITQALT